MQITDLELQKFIGGQIHENDVVSEMKYYGKIVSISLDGDWIKIRYAWYIRIDENDEWFLEKWSGELQLGIKYLSKKLNNGAIFFQDKPHFLEWFLYLSGQGLDTRKLEGFNEIC